MGELTDLKDFDMGKIVRVLSLGQSNSKMAGLVGCTYQNGLRKDNWWTDNRVMGAQSLLKRKLAILVQFHRRDTVEQTAEKEHAGYNRKVPEYHSLLLMGLCRSRLLPLLTPVHHRKTLQWTLKHHSRTMEQRKKVVWSEEWYSVRVVVPFIGIILPIRGVVWGKWPDQDIFMPIKGALGSVQVSAWALWLVCFYATFYTASCVSVSLLIIAILL